MPRLLAEDLLLLCWDDDKGAVRSRCSNALAPGIGGALVLDAVLTEAVTVDDGRAVPTGTEAGDPLVAEVVTLAERRRRPPTIKKLVRTAGTTKRVKTVRDRLVASSVLRAERRRLLGLIPVTRYPVADPERATAVRHTVRSLLTGARQPDDSDPRDLVLAALAKPTSALEALVERGERKAARQRAESFGEGYGVPAAVGTAVQETQAAAMAAVTAAVAASSSASGSGSS